MQESNTREHDMWEVGSQADMTECMTRWLAPLRRKERVRFVCFPSPKALVNYLSQFDSPYLPMTNANGGTSLNNCGKYRTWAGARARMRREAAGLEREFEFEPMPRTGTDPIDGRRLRWRELMPMFYVVYRAEHFHVLYAWTES